jgi:hypothetical protein
MKIQEVVDVVVQESPSGSLQLWNPAFSKPALVARDFFADRRHRKPSVGERWRCRVVRDTKPDDSTRGLLLLWPDCQLPSQELYRLQAGRKSDKFAVDVVLTVYRGELPIRSLSWLCDSEQALKQYWPEAVKHAVRHALSVRSIAGSSTVPGRTFNASPAVLQTAPRYFTMPRGLRFVNPQPITVTALNHDARRMEREISLSTGETFRVSARNIGRITRGDVRTVAWNKAKLICVGDVFSYEYPFQWVNEQLTNGTLWLPRLCPRSKAKWRELGIAPIPAKGWPMFLAGLEGRVCADLLEYQERDKAEREAAEAAKRKPVLTPFQQQVRAVVQGQMWKGNENVEAVSIGAMLVFHVRKENGETVYLVDNPGVGALFVFHKEDDATAFARGLISRTEARNSGFQAIEHRPGWEGEIELVLKS